MLVQFSLLASFFLRQLLAASFLNYSWLTLLYRVKVSNQLELMPIVQKSTELNYIYEHSLHFLVIECGKRKQTAVKYGGKNPTGGQICNVKNSLALHTKLKATFCGGKIQTWNCLYTMLGLRVNLMLSKNFAPRCITYLEQPWMVVSLVLK